MKVLTRLSTSALDTVNEQRRVIEVLIKLWRTLPTTAPGELQQVLPAADEAGALIAQGRGYLATPATDREIKVALTVLNHGMKWPGREVISDPANFLIQLFHMLAARKYPAAVLYHAVLDLIASHNWMPPIREVLRACDDTKAAARAAIGYLNAPTGQQTRIAWSAYHKFENTEQLAKELEDREQYAVLPKVTAESLQVYYDAQFELPPEQEIEAYRRLALPRRSNLANFRDVICNSHRRKYLDIVRAQPTVSDAEDALGDFAYYNENRLINRINEWKLKTAERTI